MPSHSSSRDVDVRVWFVSACIFAFTISCSLIVLLAMETTSSDLLFTAGSDIMNYAVTSAVLTSTVLIGTFLSIISVWFHLRAIQLPSILGTCTFALTILFTIFWAGSLAAGHWNGHMEEQYMAKYWYPFYPTNGPSVVSTTTATTTGDITTTTAVTSEVITTEANITTNLMGIDSLATTALSADEIRTLLASEEIGRGKQLRARSQRLRDMVVNCPYAVPSLHCCGWNEACPEGCNMTTSCKAASEAEASDFAIKVIVICVLILLLVGACASITLWRRCSRRKEHGAE